MSKKFLETYKEMNFDNESKMNLNIHSMLLMIDYNVFLNLINDECIKVTILYFLQKAKNFEKLMKELSNSVKNFEIFPRSNIL